MKNAHGRTCKKQKYKCIYISLYMKTFLETYICLDFIQGACTESLDGQVQLVHVGILDGVKKKNEIEGVC